MPLLLLLLSFIAFAAPEPIPPVGNYQFLDKFELTNCAEYGDTRGIVAHCKRFETKHFKKDDVIKVEEFFWDDKTNSFGAKYVHLGTFRSIPMKLLKRVQTSSPK